MEKDKPASNIEQMFQLFSSGAMNARPYVKKSPLPASVTVLLGPKEMEMLQVIAARIGAPRTNVAHHVLKLGLYEAAYGCGFTVDEDGNIPEEEKKWDTTPRTQGFSHTGEDKEAE